MPFYINTNISSLTAQMNLTNTQNSLSTSLQRLSSGLRINSAKDDAAGFAISQRMSALIGGLSQAQRNANDAISLAQTAGGALGTVSTNLQTLLQLAVQSANSTNTSIDRNAIQTQAAQIISQIDQTATSTQFNGANLIDGSFQNMAFQIGAAVGQTASISIGSARTAALGSSSTAALTADGNSNALASGDLVINGVTVGPSLASSDTSSTAGASSSAIAKAGAINAVSSQTGVTAAVNATVAQAANTMALAAGSSGTITINNVAISVTAGSTTSQTRAATVAAINAVTGQTGVVASDTGADATGIQLTAADGRNIAVTMSVLSTNFGIASTTTYGGYTLSSSQAISISSNGTLTDAGVTAGTYNPQTAYASTIAGQSTAALAAGDILINGVAVGASLATYDTGSTSNATFSALSKAAAVNAISTQTGVTATASTVTGYGTGVALSTTSGSAGTITVNGVATSTITMTGTASTDRAAIVAAINAISGQTGVTAVDLGGTTANNSVKLVAADGRNIVTTNSFAGSASVGFSATTFYGTVTLSSTSAFTIAAGTTTTANAALTDFGMAVGTYGGGKTGQALSSVNLSTVTGANNAINAINNAINAVNTIQANLGAMQNRFTSVISTLQNSTTNLNSANSRIMDADFAAETANLSRAQILQQAGTAMLAQANQLPSTVLTLLK